jgi:hypothetical protein
MVAHLRDVLVERVVSVLTQEAADRFMFFELSPLVGPSGLLVALKPKGQSLHLARSQEERALCAGAMSKKFIVPPARAIN